MNLLSTQLHAPDSGFPPSQPMVSASEELSEEEPWVEKKAPFLGWRVPSCHQLLSLKTFPRKME